MTNKLTKDEMCGNTKIYFQEIMEAQNKQPNNKSDSKVDVEAPLKEHIHPTQYTSNYNLMDVTATAPDEPTQQQQPQNTKQKIETYQKIKKSQYYIDDNKLGCTYYIEELPEYEQKLEDLKSGKYIAYDQEASIKRIGTIVTYLQHARENTNSAFIIINWTR